MIKVRTVVAFYFSALLLSLSWLYFISEDGSGWVIILFISSVVLALIGISLQWRDKGA